VAVCRYCSVWDLSNRIENGLVANVGAGLHENRPAISEKVVA